MSLPTQDKEEQMMLLSMYVVEWEKRAREERERRTEAQQARLRRIVSSTVKSGQARPKALSLAGLVAALR